MYSEPESRSRSEIEVDLAATDSAIVAQALVDAAHFIDGDWAEDRALESMRDDRPAVRRTAVVALAVLARRGVLRRDAGFWSAIEEAQADPGLVGTIDDLLDDIRIYLDRTSS